MIKALPTTYNGVQFKSRTEARWAAYFDLMGVEWRYEDEAYLLPSGGYLPDFYLPMNNCYAEVKGDDGFDLAAIRKVLELANVTQRSVLCLDGPPAGTVYLRVYGGTEPHMMDVPIQSDHCGAFIEVPIYGDEAGGLIEIPCEFVPLNHRKDRFTHGSWWSDSMPNIGYGSQWRRRSDISRIQLWGGDESVEAAIVRNATTTRAGELIVRRMAS